LGDYDKMTADVVCAFSEEAQVDFEEEARFRGFIQPDLCSHGFTMRFYEEGRSVICCEMEDECCSSEHHAVNVKAPTITG
jgi:hypothetical protein